MADFDFKSKTEAPKSEVTKEVKEDKKDEPKETKTSGSIVVKDGDTWASIATSNKIGVAKLKSVNPNLGNKLEVDDKIQLP